MPSRPYIPFGHARFSAATPAAPGRRLAGCCFRPLPGSHAGVRGLGPELTRWPAGHRLWEWGATVPRTTYRPPRAREVLRATAPNNSSRKTRDRMTGAHAQRQDRHCLPTSAFNESLICFPTFSSFFSASPCLMLHLLAGGLERTSYAPDPGALESWPLPTAVLRSA